MPIAARIFSPHALEARASRLHRRAAAECRAAVEFLAAGRFCAAVEFRAAVEFHFSVELRFSVEFRVGDRLGDSRSARAGSCVDVPAARLCV